VIRQHFSIGAISSLLAWLKTFTIHPILLNVENYTKST